MIHRRWSRREAQKDRPLTLFKATLSALNFLMLDRRTHIVGLHKSTPHDAYSSRWNRSKPVPPALTCLRRRYLPCPPIGATLTYIGYVGSVEGSAEDRKILIHRFAKECTHECVFQTSPLAVNVIANGLNPAPFAAEGKAVGRGTNARMHHVTAPRGCIRATRVGWNLRYPRSHTAIQISKASPPLHPALALTSFSRTVGPNESHCSNPSWRRRQGRIGRDRQAWSQEHCTDARENDSTFIVFTCQSFRPPS